MAKNSFKDIIFIVAALIIVAVGAAIYYSGAPHPAPAAPAAGTALSVATGTVSESGQASGQNYTVTAGYPKLTGSPNADAFNAYALALVNAQINDFKAAIAQNDISQLPPQMQGLANTFNIRYSLDGLAADHISAVFGSETYLIGMAHPSHLLTSLNVDLKNGSIIKLQDLFKLGADYASLISSLATADLLRQIQTGVYVSTPDFLAQTGGASADAQNFQVFGLSPQGLVIHFQDYQVGPGASGPAAVTIPYSSLKSVAQPGGFLDR